MSSPAATAAPAPTPAPLARLERVSITHEDAPEATPKGVSFEIARGEVVLLLGPSGSGKSTLALALDGLIPHSVPAAVAGRIEVSGVDTATTTVARLSTHVGMVFQDPDAQLVTGTVLDEVAFGPENLRLPVDEVLRRAEAALRRVGLWERRHENPDRLSGGGRQRLAIAAALALGSPLLVLDEPTANLDPAGIEDVYAALADLVAAGDHGILLVEHNLDAAIGFVDRVVVLDGEGRLVADGPAEQTLRERAGELHDLGVWLPTATLAALRLHRAGYRLDPLPLTPDQLHAALVAHPPLADGAPPPRADHGRTAPGVRVAHLTLRRGRTTVLHDVSLEVPAGSFTAIVGANGAGKTSLLQAIAGVVPPPRGTVHLGEVDVARADPRSLPSRIGFVFQNPEHQFVAHTVFDEVAQGLRRQRLDEAEVRERTVALLDRFGLAEMGERHPFLLSGGQKRRLSVGTALVAGAPVVALDEPTFGQDRARAEELLRLLQDLNDEGTTVLVVTHDMQLVSEHADRTVVLESGRVAAAGRTGEVFADVALIERAGLRLPPLRRALGGLSQHPSLASATRLADLPGADLAAPHSPGTPG
ncbi:ABC transporter ATP-binding protein [Microbacterium sp. SORGH_AS_0888]|uniref:ABC transporter ATP-binding protein n=1 Tax=Microbacterium sp. SORGH_AS_0888 TaxID=3041791 RepID=UPI002786333F|nr:ABC transporter ATP-binding protein [Microbacterium sp. SORGH_AS_0888]MDQ1130155.1 energy-coupling factor transporter ATP-binding protein EcfA2 [Microbacterium sp. SORGH_AS_0888]